MQVNILKNCSRDISVVLNGALMMPGNEGTLRTSNNDGLGADENYMYVSILIELQY